MKLAVLILCHKGSAQIKKLISALDHPDITVFVHVDKKAEALFDELTEEKVVLVPTEKRVDVQWATISQVDATLVLLKCAVKEGNYDYYMLCSGQDFPLTNAGNILHFLKRQPKQNFINLIESQNYMLGKSNNFDKRNQIIFPDWLISRKVYLRVLKRIYIEFTGGYNKTYRLFVRRNTTNMAFFFGSQWWCLTGEAVSQLLMYLEEHDDYYNYFSKCLCPDESFFQTLMMNSPFRGMVADHLHYVDWSEGRPNPKILIRSDIPAMMRSGKIMARKFDSTVDEKVLELLTHEILQESE